MFTFIRKCVLFVYEESFYKYKWGVERHYF